MFDKGIIALNKELLALKQEKMKMLSQMNTAGTVFSLSADTNRQYRIQVKPKNNVIPLLTAFLNTETVPNYGIYLGIYEVDYDNFKITYYFSQDSGSTKNFEIVFRSTSKLEVELL